jgi:hypothetical protein
MSSDELSFDAMIEPGASKIAKYGIRRCFWCNFAVKLLVDWLDGHR